MLSTSVLKRDNAVGSLIYRKADGVDWIDDGQSLIGIFEEIEMKRKKTAVERAVSDRTVIQRSREQIMSRPDGYYWRTLDGRNEFGPFEALDMALADMELVDEETPAPGETLQEAEDEIGISDWIDPDTGELAEGMSHPRFDDH